MTAKSYKKTISKNFLLRKYTTPVLNILCMALMLVTLPGTAISCNYSGLDYLNITVGHGIKYHVTDDDGSLNCNVWTVSRPTNNGDFTFTTHNNSDFAFTLTETELDELHFRNSWLRGAYFSDFDAYIFDSGCPTGNQAIYYSMFTVLKEFDSGNHWTALDKEYGVEDIGEHSVNGTSFPDCIRVTVSNSHDASDDLNGNGHFILAKDIGIVQMVFNRNNGYTVLFEYLDHGQQTLHTISGTISSTTEGSVEGLVVQLSNCDNAVKSAVDSRGSFTLNAFGPDVVLRVGYDNDNDGEFDPEYYPDYPKEYHINCLTSEVTTSDTGFDLQVYVTPADSSSTTTTTDCKTTTTTPDDITTTTVPVTTTVPETDITLDFMGSPTLGVAPLTVNFTNLSQGNIESYLWNFGDGTTSTEQNPSHTYTDIGNFGVILTAYGIDGSPETEVRSDYVIVLPECLFMNALDNQGNIKILRNLRDSLLTNIFGLILTAVYYQNSAELTSILAENPDLQDDLRDLVGENINVALNLINKRKTSVSKDNVDSVIELLNDIQLKGSPRLKADINLVTRALRKSYFLYGLGVEVR